MATADIEPLVANALSGTGFEVDEVTVSSAGRRRVLRVSVDRVLPDGGDITEPTPPISLDEVADATRAIDAALDAANPWGETPYTLEVSSPGVGRPLRGAKAFRRNVGRLVTVAADGAEPVTGRIVRAGDTDVALDVPPQGKVPGETVTIAYDAVTRAEVQVEFNRAEPRQDED